ncbi:MAG: hypothetical protein SNF68_00015 [Rikenellaceae bacterium]
MRQAILIAALCALASCGGEIPTERYQTTRDNIVDVSEKLVKIDLGEDLLLGQGSVTIVGEYLLIGDYTSKKELLHILDRTSFDHIWSGLRKGRGRGEVQALGKISADEERRCFFAIGRGNAVAYNVDSLMNMRDYTPANYGSIRISDDSFDGTRSVGSIEYVNDTLSFALLISIPKDGRVSVSNGMLKIKGGSLQTTAFNTTKGGVNIVGRSYPDDVEPFFCGTGSLRHNLIAEGHQSKDLLSLHDLEGNLICNVFGPDWESLDEKIGFKSIHIIDDQIFATYSGRNVDEPKMEPECITIFDINGEYLKTLDFGVGIFSYTYDKKRDRLILFVESEENPIVYIDMKNL